MVKCPQNAGLLKTELPPVFSTTSGSGGSKEEYLIRRNTNENRGSPIKTGRDATECGVRIAGAGRVSTEKVIQGGDGFDTY